MSDHLLRTKVVAGGMPDTCWSLVRAAGSDATRRERALEEFSRDYWPAVYAFVRSRGHSPPEAEDLTQGFLVSLIERDSLATVEEGSGRFRSWLLAALKNYLKVDWRNKNRLKRGGGALHLSIDRDLEEGWLEVSAVDNTSPEAVFDRRWAWGILERALAELNAMYERDGRGETVRILAPLVMGSETQKTYADAAKELGTSHANARVMGFRLRKRLRTLVREEVARTVGSQEEIENELGILFEVFGSA